MITYSKLSDTELTALLKTQDHAAFTEIYNRYCTVLYLHARHMLHQEDQARDVVQEVFTRLWDKRSDFELTVSLNAYLYKSVKNIILNMVRHEKVAGNYLVELGYFYEEGKYSTEEQVHLNELLRLIELEIQKLPAEIKKVFELSRKQHLNNLKIAQKLDKSEQTVKKQISRAIQILRLKLNLPAPILLLLLKFLK
jgi:RNA polymerase sigma-70 factor (ECF subfamily)